MSSHPILLYVRLDKKGYIIRVKILICLLLQKKLPNLVHRAGSDGDYHIGRTGIFMQIICNLFKSF